jgi:glycine cleavage system T protein
MSSQASEIIAAQSPLADLHAGRSAPIIAYHGAELPARFADPVIEHGAVRSGAGVFDFAFRSRFTLSGEHRARFLHRIISNDVKNLAAGHGVYATLLSAQGRILADFYVYADAERLWIDTDADLAAKTMAALQRYIIGDRVVIEASDFAAVALQGPQSLAALESQLGLEPVGTLAAMTDELDHVAVQFEGHPARIVRRSSTGEPGYEIWLAPAAVCRLWTRALAAGLAPCGVEALEILRIEAGIARYGPDFGEDTLPLEAGLLSALSFNKGCYIGQEIVERARSRGHVNWKLVGLQFPAGAAVPECGEKLRGSGGAEIGEITSACLSPALARPVALGYVRREVSEPGTNLESSGSVGIEVSALPFIFGTWLNGRASAPLPSE